MSFYVSTATFFFAPLWRMGPRCSSAETQVCQRSYIIAANQRCDQKPWIQWPKNQRFAHIIIIDIVLASKKKLLFYTVVVAIFDFRSIKHSTLARDHPMSTRDSSIMPLVQIKMVCSFSYSFVIKTSLMTKSCVDGHLVFHTVWVQSCLFFLRKNYYSLSQLSPALVAILDFWYA